MAVDARELVAGFEHPGGAPAAECAMNRGWQGLAILAWILPGVPVGPISRRMRLVLL
jgi:hypothetical protein